MGREKVITKKEEIMSKNLSEDQRVRMSRTHALKEDLVNLRACSSLSREDFVSILISFTFHEMNKMNHFEEYESEEEGC